MTEKRKWMMVAGLCVVLAVMLAHRLDHRPGPSSSRVPRAAAAPAATIESPATVAPSTPPEAARQAASSSPPPDGADAVALARAAISRQPPDRNVPQRDLFALAYEQPSRPEPLRDAYAGPLPAPAAEAPPTRSSVPQLQATLMDGAARVAVLDGRAVREGEEIRGFVVKRVEDGRVVLARDGKPLVLTMEKQ